MFDESKVFSLIDNFEAYGNAETTSTILKFSKLKNNVQNFKKDKTVYVLVGPSGSGKSTFIANMYNQNIFNNSQESFVPFVNRHYSNTSMSLNDEILFKTKLLKNGYSFMMESANFDKSYSDFIKIMKLKFDYNICLLYLTKRSPKENIEMVKKRKTEGGHGSIDVELNEVELEKMYKVDSKNLVEVLPYCDSCFVINNVANTNNSKTDKPIVLLHKGIDGTIEFNTEMHNISFLYYRILKSTKLILQSREQTKMRFFVKDGSKRLKVMLPSINAQAKSKLILKVNNMLDEIKDFSLENAKREYSETESKLDTFELEKTK